MTRKHALLAGLAISLTGCASHDAQGEFIFGGANRANIATQSIRDVNTPNYKAVEGQSGERATVAVERHRSGPSEQSSSATGGSTTDAGG